MSRADASVAERRSYTDVIQFYAQGRLSAEAFNRFLWGQNCNQLARGPSDEDVESEVRAVLDRLVNYVCMRHVVAEDPTRTSELEDYQQRCWSHDERMFQLRQATAAIRRSSRGTAGPSIGASRSRVASVGSPSKAATRLRDTVRSAHPPVPTAVWLPGYVPSYADVVLAAAPPRALQFAAEFENPLKARPQTVADRQLQRKLRRLSDICQRDEPAETIGRSEHMYYGAPKPKPKVSAVTPRVEQQKRTDPRWHI